MTTPFYVIDNPLPAPAITLSAPPESNITFYGGNFEMLKVTEDGFSVRGVKVKADENDAASGYKAFKSFLVHHALTKEY